MIAIDERYCPKNHYCPAVHSCPVGAIVQDDYHSAPRIDAELCTDCGVCTAQCRTFVQVDTPAWTPASVT